MRTTAPTAKFHVSSTMYDLWGNVGSPAPLRFSTIVISTADWPPRPPARPRLCLQAGWLAGDAVVAAVAAAAVAAVAAVAAGSKLPTSSPDRGMDG